MEIALGSDHAGFSLKEEIKMWLEEAGHASVDVGTDDPERSVDYPDFAAGVARRVIEGEVDLGILVCGTGLGMSMAANKYSGVRAARCQDTYSARMARKHNNANILTLGERVLGAGLAREIVEAFLEADFDGGRHMRRINKIENPEGEMK